MKKYPEIQIMAGLGVFILGSTMAMASMSTPTTATQPSASSPATQNNSGGYAPPMMSSPAQSGPKVSQIQITHFANAVRAIEPLSAKVQQDATRKGITTAQKETLQNAYTQKVKAILAKNQLSPASYEAMLRKAHSDPQFAQRVEALLKSGG
ncbi:MAG: DUF4168 domain-containing protein [Acidithiobacillus sp.]